MVCSYHVLSETYSSQLRPVVHRDLRVPTPLNTTCRLGKVPNRSKLLSKRHERIVSAAASLEDVEVDVAIIGAGRFSFQSPPCASGVSLPWLFFKNA